MAFEVTYISTYNLVILVKIPRINFRSSELNASSATPGTSSFAWADRAEPVTGSLDDTKYVYLMVGLFCPENVTEAICAGSHHFKESFLNSSPSFHLT